MDISVITPVYKGQKYLDKLVNMISKNVKLLKQQHPNIEVELIFVNDYPELPLRFFEEKGTNFRIVFMENIKNEGIHQSRVNGLERATGKFIYFLDQDDEIADNCLLSQFGQIKDADVIVANGYRKFPDRNELLYSRNLALKLARKERMYIYGTDMILSPGQCLIKKTAIPDQWKENIMKVNGCDDLFLWLLMFQTECKFVLNQDRLYYHTETEDNFSASSENMTDSFEDMCDILESANLIDNWKVRILRRRYRLKVAMKNSSNPFTKFFIAIKNIDVIIHTIGYKLAGFY